MLGHIDMLAIVAVVLLLVFAGVHIAISLGITAALGLYLMTGDVEVVRTFTANTAYEALRDYVFDLDGSPAGVSKPVSAETRATGQRAIRGGIGAIAEYYRFTPP